MSKSNSERAAWAVSAISVAIAWAFLVFELSASLQMPVMI